MIKNVKTSVEAEHRPNMGSSYMQAEPRADLVGLNVQTILDRPSFGPNIGVIICSYMQAEPQANLGAEPRQVELRPEQLDASARTSLS